MTWICDFLLRATYRVELSGPAFYRLRRGRTLIESNDFDGLACRAIKKLITRHPEMQPAQSEFLVHMKRLHQSFFDSRLCAASRVQPGDEPVCQRELDHGEL